jgi:peptide/nickel transport system substrate-binding protein
MVRSLRTPVRWVVCLVWIALLRLGPVDAQEYAVESGSPGNPGGRLVSTLRTEPKTLNPIISIDASSREILGLLHADLIHINRETQRTEPALAKSWTVTPNGLRYTLELRRGLAFSDGLPFSADDVVFSFALYLDERLHSPQRDLLVFDGKPLSVRKVDAYTVEFNLPKPYGPGERLFDGLAMLPKHLLEKSYLGGTLDQTLSLSAQPATLAGLGPFRFKEYLPGERLSLERNPYYWKTDGEHRRLPYLDGVDFVFIASEDAQLLRFRAAQLHLLGRISADNFETLRRSTENKRLCSYDLGPGLEVLFLLFNMNPVSSEKNPELFARQSWFREVRFRQAVSLAMDRPGMAKLVYRGLATPIWGNVSPGNKFWIDSELPHPERNLEQAKRLLEGAGFRWSSDGALLDSRNRPVRFTLLVSSSNAQRMKLATIAQEDLKTVGIVVEIVPLEFRALVDHVLNAKDYDAALMNMVNGDADPMPEMNLWRSDGETHLWNLGESKPETSWEGEIDRLMDAQMSETDQKKRKHFFDQAQEVIGRNVPLVYLLAPNVLVAAQSTVRNFRPAILEPNMTWNLEQVYLEHDGNRPCQ